MEKRGSKRYPKGIRVQFGTDKCSHIGLTYNLSENGILLKSNRVFQPLTKLILELSLSSEQKIYCEGYVQWAKQGPPALAYAVKKSGMGILLVNTPEEYHQFIDRLGHREQHHHAAA